MVRIRVIPTLLLHRGGLIKSIKFANYKYVGDPINVVRIFNEKEVDELAIIDIDATRDKREPNFKQISEIVSEAFMPVAYGGGVNSLDQIKEIFYRGVEKVVLNKAAVTNERVITESAKLFGSQSVVASIDVKKVFLKGYRVYTDNGRNDTGLNPVEFAKRLRDRGAGEILLNSIDRDGTYRGYDAPLISLLAESVDIPVIALGGAGSIEDFKKAIQNGASAVAAGSMFVFKRPHQAVLVSYPSPDEILNINSV
jgi:cyclase